MATRTLDRLWQGERAQPVDVISQGSHIGQSLHLRVDQREEGVEDVQPGLFSLGGGPDHIQERRAVFALEL